MAKFKGFIGPSYQMRSISFDAQRSVNLMPVKSEVDDSKNIVALCSTPGLLERWDLGTGPIRATHEVFGRGFVVSGKKLYEIFSDYTSSELGTLVSSYGTCQIADNGLQLAIVDGLNLYTLALSNNAFLRVIAPGWLGSYSVTFLDGYFNFIKPNSGMTYVSDLYNAGGIDPLNFASAEANPDNLVGQAVLHQQLWLFGTETTQIFFDAAGTSYPFAPIGDGGLIEYGAAAANSISTNANTVFWLHKDNEGQGVVFMANGYQPQRISTFAVETAIASYGDISDAVGYNYQEEGHWYYVLNFPSANTTWAYDVNLNLWHERAYFQNGQYTRHRAQNHMFIFNKHFVGDYSNGKVYEQSLNIYDDNGNEIRRMRTCAHIADNEDLNYISYYRFQADVQVGVGLTNAPYKDPQAALSWSDDGGYTWSSTHWRSMGKIGKYLTRAIWRQLGRARDRVFKLQITAACKVFLIAANVKTTLGSN